MEKNLRILQWGSVMKMTNRFLLNLILKLRNRISANHNSICISSIHSANNEIIIRGKRNTLSFEGQNGYIRSGKVMIEGNDNGFTVKDKSILSNDCNIRIVGNNNNVYIGSDCRITNMSIYIFGDDNLITIENSISSVYTSFHIEENHNSVYIAKGTTLHGRKNNRIEFALDEGSEIKVGEDCMISNDVCLRSSDSHSVLNEKMERINPAGNILISSHVWICMRSLILKNTILPRSCVVGAGSICNKDYEKENCLIAGNPAKIIKEKISWSRDRL